MLFWSILLGGAVLGIGFLGFNVRQNYELVWCIAAGMISGAVLRFVIAKIKKEPKRAPILLSQNSRTNPFDLTNPFGWILTLLAAAAVLLLLYSCNKVFA